MEDIFTMNKYIYKVCNGFRIVFLAREDKTANEMKELYEKGMGLEIKFKKKKPVYVNQPPYSVETQQLESLRRGLELCLGKTEKD